MKLLKIISLYKFPNIRHKKLLYILRSKIYISLSHLKKETYHKLTYLV